MTELDAFEARAPTPERRRGWRWLPPLILTGAVLGAGGWAGWQLWQTTTEVGDVAQSQDVLLRRLSRQLADVQADLGAQRERQREVMAAARRNGDAVGALAERFEAVDTRLAGLDATLAGGRGRAQLIAIEQLLLIAHERAWLARDLPTAIAALTDAQQRLGLLADPALFPIREAIAEERSALEAVPRVDLEAQALMLSALIARSPSLPLRSRLTAAPLPADAGPDPVDTGTGAGAAASGGASFWARGRASFAELFGAIFTIRRTDKPVDRLLPPAQEALVGQILLLKLETARAALLARRSSLLAASVAEVDRWLAEQYRSEDPAVIGARSELTALRGLELAPALPEGGRALGLLRAHLDARAR